MGGSFNEIFVGLNVDSEQAKSALEGFRGTVESVLSAAQGNFLSLGTAIEHALGPIGILGGTAVAVGGAMFEMAAHASEVGAKIFEVSEKTGISAGQLSGLRALTIETGESFESLSTSLGRMGVNIEKALINQGGTGGKIIHALFETTKEYNDFALLPSAERMEVLLQKIFALNTVEEQNLALTAFLGRGWQGNRESLKELAEGGFALAEQKAKDFNQYYDDERARQSKEFDRAWQSLKATLSGVADTIGSSLVPAFTDMFNAMSGRMGTTETLSRMEEEMRKFGFAISTTGQILSKADIDKAKAAQTENTWHNEVTIGVEAAKEQSKAINAGLEGWQQQIHVTAAATTGHKSLIEVLAKHKDKTKELGEATDDAAKHLEKFYTGLHATVPAFTTAGTSLEKFLDDVHKLNLAVSGPALNFPGGSEKENYGVLARIGLPSTAEGMAQWSANVGKAAAAAGGSLRGLTSEVTQRINEMAAKGGISTRQLQNSYLQMELGTRGSLNRMTVDARKALNISRQDLETWARDTGIALSFRQQQFLKMEEVVTSTINKELLAYGFSQKALQGIYQDLLKDLGAYLAHEAHLQALKQIAKGMSDIADFNYAGAALHFAAAAGWEALGAGVSGLAGSLAGMGSGGSSSARGTSGTAATAAGAGLPPRPPTMAAGTMAGGGNVTVHVMGESQHAQYIAKVLNKAVRTQDLNLVARRVSQPVYSGR